MPVMCARHSSRLDTCFKVLGRPAHAAECRRQEFDDARQMGTDHSAPRSHLHGALWNSQTSAASCLRTGSALAEDHQPPPEDDDDDDDDGVVVPDLRSEPVGVMAHHMPPEALRSLPLIWPAAVSPEYVYRG
jgi:hypothetical protein